VLSYFTKILFITAIFVSTYGLKLFTNSKKIIVLNVKVKALQNCFFSLLFGFASFRILRISGPERETNKKIGLLYSQKLPEFTCKTTKNTRVINNQIKLVITKFSKTVCRT